MSDKKRRRTTDAERALLKRGGFLSFNDGWIREDASTSPSGWCHVYTTEEALHHVRRSESRDVSSES